MEEDKRMGRGGSALVVKDSSLRIDFTKDWQTPEFIFWLEERGFKKAQFPHGWWDYIDWVFVDIPSRLYQPGMPGIKICQVLTDKKITIDEFKTIYEIVSAEK